MPQSQVSPIAYLFLWAPILGIFYFLIIRPQQKREKEHQKMLSSVAANDKIVTTGGIHGTVVNTKERTLIIRIDESVKIEVDRSAIASVKKQEAKS